MLIEAGFDVLRVLLEKVQQSKEPSPPPAPRSHREIDLHLRRLLVEHFASRDSHLTLQPDQQLAKHGERFSLISSFYTVHEHFASEKAARQLFEAVAARLQEGGHFLLFLHNARPLLELLRSGAREYTCREFQFEPRWQGKPQAFGSAYTLREFAPPTFVAPVEVHEGSLISLQVIVALARKHGLVTSVLPEEMDTWLELQETRSEEVAYRFRPSRSGSTGLSHLEATKTVMVFYHHDRYF